MRSPENRIAFYRVIALVTGLITLGGCTQLQDWVKRDRTGSDANGVILGAPDPEYYLDEMYRVATGDPAAQAAAVAAADTAAMQAPGPSTRLRLGLVLAVPGHAQADLARAQGIFSDLLSTPELLTPAERALATVFLRDTEQRLLLTHEAERLQEVSSELASTERRAIERRLRQAEAQNRELRQALQDAEEKLEAITSIERSIRERADGADQQ